MRMVQGVTFVLAVFCLGGVVESGECPKAVAAAAERVRAALAASETPDLVHKVAAKHAEAAALAKLLASHPESLAEVTAEALAATKTLAFRDAEHALSFARWLQGIAVDARRKAPKEAHRSRALRSALLLHGRVANDLGAAAPAKVWTRAADLTITCDALRGRRADPAAAWIEALGILEEGAKAEKAGVVALWDHAGILCARALKAHPESTPIRRTVVLSYQKQMDALQDISRKRAQKAFQGYFEAYAPIATAERAPTQDRRAWNARVSLARERKVKVKASYVGRKGLGADRLVSYLLPDTGRWKVSKGAIVQIFPGDLFRMILFDTYDWDTVYTLANSRRTVGGDNVKGVAGRNFDSRLNECEEKGLKVKRKKKPKRTKLNKRLPAGIEYSIDFLDDDGLMTRERSFLVKAVKAEKTVQILIIEATALTEYDPEFEAVLESLEITKKTR